VIWDDDLPGFGLRLRQSATRPMDQMISRAQISDTPRPPLRPTATASGGREPCRRGMRRRSAARDRPPRARIGASGAASLDGWRATASSRPNSQNSRTIAIECRSDPPFDERSDISAARPEQAVDIRAELGGPNHHGPPRRPREPLHACARAMSERPARAARK
jgi:hypothetical protein